jgi:hypothetical protein
MERVMHIDLDDNPSGLRCPSCSSTDPVEVRPDVKWEYDGERLVVVDYHVYGGTQCVCKACNWRTDMADFEMRRF